MEKTNGIRSIVDSGSRGIIVSIECHISNGLPAIVIVGYANKAVDEAKERIRSAFASSDLTLPRKRITVNLAPADIPKDSTALDIGVALGILQASRQIKTILPDAAVYGELGLDGDIRPIRGIIGKLLAGIKLGMRTFIIPFDNLEQAGLVPGISLLPVRTLKELVTILNAETPPELTDTSSLVSTVMSDAAPQPGDTTIDDVIGQELGKRAVEISAAGGHNLLLGGPPGTGKSMLARVLPGLLPPMSRDEMLEVTHLHSLAGNEFSRIITLRPFRSPHHSASNVAVVGGGNSVRPGEMSLSHRGVLLFDELPEFDRVTVEALRQPLETRTVVIARAKETAEYPAHFIFVGTANPCPCGHYQTSKECRCLPSQVMRYRRKLSGPILDRIDLYVDVHEIDNSRLLADEDRPTTHDTICRRIEQARQRQRQRYGGDALNGDMTNRQAKSLAGLDPQAKQLLDTAAEKFGLSARAYMRSVKVARTIADLADSDHILTQHVAEALQYRPHQYEVA